MNRIVTIATLAGVIILDRLTKLVVIRGWTKDIIFIHLGRFDNHGLAFSIPAAPWLAITMMSMVIIILGTWLAQQRRRLVPIILLAAGLILIGAISNLTDRFVYGVVIDWISFGRWFPIFNLADLAITTGVVMWVSSLTKPKQVT